MGSVCTSTLSLYNTDVPFKAPVTGIAIGLVSVMIDGEAKYYTLTDILGTGDALGDMGSKVAGTHEYVTALQLGTKLDGIPAAALDAALGQVCDAHFVIFDLITETVDGPDEMATTAPRIITARIPVDKISEVIGPKGKMINQIQEDMGAEISIEDDGTIFIGATDSPSVEATRQAVNAIANPQMPEIGERSVGTVVRTTTFGAFVSLVPGRDGPLYISQIRRVVDGKHVENVEDVLSVDDKVEVEIVEIDPRGKVSLHTIVKEEPEIPAKQEEAERLTRREHESRQVSRQRHRSSESSGLTE